MGKKAEENSTKFGTSEAVNKLLGFMSAEEIADEIGYAPGTVISWARGYPIRYVVDLAIQKLLADRMEKREAEKAKLHAEKLLYDYSVVSAIVLNKDVAKVRDTLAGEGVERIWSHQIDWHLDVK